MAWIGMFGAPGFFRNDLCVECVSLGVWHFCFVERVSGHCVPQNAGGHVASAANGHHQLRVELIQNALRRALAQLVDLDAADTACQCGAQNRTASRYGARMAKSDQAPG